MSRPNCPHTAHVHPSMCCLNSTDPALRISSALCKRTRIEVAAVIFFSHVPSQNCFNVIVNVRTGQSANPFIYLKYLHSL
ncbi:hypothetical protein GDO78_011068 [Eleutherodactylus coqui]|uniref:Uncharacterized protein n=1 Tax=Eleutherodactylus coqui TaxID=57060 RepID=A0A8J6F7I0_ELECQ|nr:hypothetical protein GDO78_011068 [Eleutherodactylus coqui]